MFSALWVKIDPSGVSNGSWPTNILLEASKSPLSALIYTDTKNKRIGFNKLSDYRYHVSLFLPPYSGFWPGCGHVWIRCASHTTRCQRPERPPASAAPADFTQKEGGRGPRSSQAAQQTCWGLEGSLYSRPQCPASAAPASFTQIGGGRGLRPSQPPPRIQYIWQGGAVQA